MGKEVDPSEYLYRGIASSPPEASLIKHDKEKGTFRPTSLAFKDSRGELSVDVASKTTPEDLLRRLPQSIGIVSFQAAIPISFDYKVVEAPVFNVPGKPDNPAHALVLSSGEPMSKTARREIAKLCSWVIPPNET
jgi:hypothetical protein